MVHCVYCPENVLTRLMLLQRAEVALHAVSDDDDVDDDEGGSNGDGGNSGITKVGVTHCVKLMVSPYFCSKN